VKLTPPFLLLLELSPLLLELLASLPPSVAAKSLPEKPKLVLLPSLVDKLAIKLSDHAKRLQEDCVRARLPRSNVLLDVEW